MTLKADQKPIEMDIDYPKSLYQRYVQAAVVRSAASFIMWLTALMVYFYGIIRTNNFVTASVAVLYLILVNPPTLWILKRIKNQNLAQYFAYFISFLEIIGFTAIIHSFGGIEATFLIPIYAAAIAYVGSMEPRKTPFIIAGLSSLCFCLLIIFEHLGILQTLKVNPDYYMPWPYQVAIMFVEVPLLFTVAFISSYTVQLLKNNREKLRRQNEKLQVALIKASESDRLKSEFLANISHELRTPLHAIIGFSDLLNNHYLGELNEKQKDSIKDINTSGKHLLAIINDLLDLGKMEAGKMDLDISETNLKIILENSLNIFKKLAQGRGNKLLSDIDDCPETIRADERMIRQIIYNLLSNAIKFTPEEGSIKLSAHHLIKANNHWLTKKGEMVYLPSLYSHERMNHKHLAKVSVADTGIGLKTEDMKLIFKPFVQVDGSKSRRYQGTGLGLSLTKQFVELHNGSIWVDSEGEDKGCTFHFVIPI
ncbi:MAG: HAMP domain-containing sensor histidine kinase [Smithellaceae bacterium]|jgi:signal transduction histidine kinase